MSESVHDVIVIVGDKVHRFGPQFFQALTHLQFEAIAEGKLAMTDNLKTQFEELHKDVWKQMSKLDKYGN